MESYARRGENAKGETMERIRDYKLTKKGETGSVRFPAFENEDGLLISPHGYPMAIADELTEAGFKPADAQLPISEVDPEILPLVLRVGDNRGNVVERIETSEERKAREKVERDNQNAFLREKGYRWEKQNFYVSGDVGDLVTRWFLIDPDGNAVVGAKDGGGFITEFGSVKTILTELGYYGQEAIDKARIGSRGSVKNVVKCERKWMPILMMTQTAPVKPLRMPNPNSRRAQSQLKSTRRAVSFGLRRIVSGMKPTIVAMATTGH